MNDFDRKNRELDARLSALIDDANVPTLAQQLAFLRRVCGPDDAPRPVVESAATINKMLFNDPPHYRRQPPTTTPSWADEDGSVLTGVPGEPVRYSPRFGLGSPPTGYYARPRRQPATETEQAIALAFSRQQANGGVLPADEAPLRWRRKATR